MPGRVLDAVRGYIKNYTEEVAEVTGVEMKLASLTNREVEMLAKVIDKMLYTEANVAVKELFIENFDLVIDLVRAVKTETKQEFAGVRARGNQLTIADLTADQFTSVWGATGADDFSYTASATGATDYLGTSTNPESVAEEEGYLILGFVELSASPKVNKTQLTKNGDAYAYNNLKFEVDETAYVAALPEPWFLGPETSYYVQMNFFKTGKVELIPIGIKALQAKNLMSL